jgi:mono/diheme cytochrome c family protein
VVAPLLVRPVEWNPARAPLPGFVRAVTEAGSVVAVFVDGGAVVFSAQTLVATDTSVKAWSAAQTVPAADGSGDWIVGVGADGRLYRLHGATALEDVTDRYGLGGEPIVGAAPMGRGDVGFLLAHDFAVADGRQVMHYVGGDPQTRFDRLAAGVGVGAAVAGGTVDVFDIAQKQRRIYPLPGVKQVAVGPDRRLYAITARGLYASDATGRLLLVYDAARDALHGLVVSGSHVWFADGPELGALDGDRVVETSGARLSEDAALAPSPSGDVWVLAGRTLSRFARASEPAHVPSWDEVIGPIFARSCSACHLPDGESGTDLSTPGAWNDERAKIRKRVVDERSMPPQGHPLSEEDRAAIKAWCAELR